MTPLLSRRSLLRLLLGSGAAIHPSRRSLGLLQMSSGNPGPGTEPKPGPAVADYRDIAAAAGLTAKTVIGGESAKALGSLTGGGRQISTLQIESELLYFRKHHGLFGLISAVCLSTFADMTLILKNIGSASTLGKASAAQQHARTVLGLLAKTRLASRATR